MSDFAKKFLHELETKPNQVAGVFLQSDWVKQTLPPNYDLIKDVFPEITKRINEAVFTHFPYVYNPGGNPIPPDVEMHERVHLEQQKQYPGGADLWWRRYLSEPDFRLDQEVEAYAAQYRLYEMSKLPQQMKKARKDAISNDLATSYGFDISAGEAQAMLARRVKTLRA